MNASSAQRYEKQKQQWENREELLNKQYADRLVHNKKSNEKTLEVQNDRFQSTYEKNADAQRESFDIQKQQYTRQMAEIKKDFANATAMYSNKESDPFYKIDDRGSYLRENPDFYILRAFVPEHEKEAVKVTVQGDKAVVSGQRSFKDKIQEDGKISSTSNYQSFREEFLFDKPVILEGMTRERQGDWITFEIPKGLASRLNRKA